MDTPNLNSLEGTVDVWLCQPAEALAPDRRRALESLLTEDELARGSRFRFERDALSHLFTRALVRRVLSRYEKAVAPEDWRFEIGSHGRPEIAAKHATLLRFNLSHTKGLIACAVALERDIGVDVELTTRRAATVRIADRFFSPSEVKELLSLAPSEQIERFFTYWTLKEAYIKARGLGLAIPLASFSFHSLTENGAAITIDPSQGDDDHRWQFLHRRQTDVHRLALAISRRGADLKIRIADFPL